MNRRLYLKALSFIASMINAILFCKISVAVFCPGSPPYFRHGVLIPVIGRNRNLFPKILCSFSFPDTCFLSAVLVERRNPVLKSILLIFRIIYRKAGIIDWSSLSIPCICENSFLLFQPLFMLIKPTHCQKNVRMGISVVFIMKCPIRYHPFTYEVFLNIFAHALNLLVSFHLCGKRYFHFSRKLCIRPLLYCLNFVP